MYKNCVIKNLLLVNKVHNILRMYCRNYIYPRVDEYLLMAVLLPAVY